MRIDLLCAICVFGLVFLTFLPDTDAGNDTPDTVQSAFRFGSAETSDLFSLTNEVNNFVTRVASDRGYATRLLDAIRNNNVAGIISVVKETAPRSSVSIESLTPDFSVRIRFTNKAHHITVCSSSQNACNGSAVSVTVS
jgi:hypothetical protein